MKGTAVINGACSSIGHAIALKLEAEGYNICPLARNKEKLISLYGNSHRGYEVDVLHTDFNELSKKIRNELGLISVFVNSVGVVPVGDPFDITDTDWELALNTNVLGAIKAGTSFAKVMKVQQSGAIVLVGGMLALQPESQLVTGGVCAAAINNFGKSLSKSLSSSGVRVNVINPGATLTPLLNNIANALAGKMSIKADDILDGMSSRNPLGRLAKPEDIANTVSFLVSESAAYLNGVFISQDGSYSGAY